MDPTLEDLKSREGNQMCRCINSYNGWLYHCVTYNSLILLSDQFSSYCNLIT